MTTALIAEVGFGHTDLRGDDPGTEIAYGRCWGDHVETYRDLGMIVIYICIYAYLNIYICIYIYIYVYVYIYI